LKDLMRIGRFLLYSKQLFGHFFVSEKINPLIHI